MNIESDRELLELAAKAVGYDTSHRMNSERLALDPPVDALWVSKGGELVHTGWNPLTDDGSAFRLAVKLGLLVDSDLSGMESMVIAVGVHESEPHGADPYAATRRAIVRAAATIAEESKS